MEGLYKYSYPHAYAASGLLNIAWAQTFQNKPNEVLEESNPDDDPMGGCVDDDVIAASDDDKEEGELEEGETYSESELMEPDENRSRDGGFGGIGMDDDEDDRVLAIRQMLDNVNAKEAEKSFDVACARLRSCVESLQELGWFPTKDALIQQLLGGFECVKSVFSAMSPLQKEQNKGAMSRLISYAMGLRPALFSPDQVKEIEAAMLLIKSSLDISQRKETRVSQGELPVCVSRPVITDPYESHALKAVSFYHQKYGQLPSPASSEEVNCGETDDAREEVSSFQNKTTLNSAKSSILPQPAVSSSANEGSSILNTRKMDGILGSAPHVISQGKAKSRDPRRRPRNTDVIAAEGPVMKTQKNDIERNFLKHHQEIRPPVVAAHSWNDVKHLLGEYDDNQKASILKERSRRIDEQKKLFTARKLSLVLDLDHTLLNSAKFSEIDPTHEEFLRRKEERDHDKHYRHLFRFTQTGMWTKLRPGIWNFLEKASKLFELHLYTMGNKQYATEMAKVLDPDGTLFGGRVISKRSDNSDHLSDTDERIPSKTTKDLDAVLGMESATLIIDDSLKVWPHHKRNLIVVERYMYFPCTRRQFRLRGPSLLEVDHDERPDVGTLASCLAVIEKVHHNFFAQEWLEDVDVRDILASEQRMILAGCRILFSGLFRVGAANPLHPLWKTAEQFGAVCTNDKDEQITHVVAFTLATEKVNWALSTGRYVVHPGWIEASAFLYRRAHELDFPVKP